MLLRLMAQVSAVNQRMDLLPHRMSASRVYEDLDH
jgi:hypothetical protein